MWYNKKSVYTSKFNDPEGIFFDVQTFPFLEEVTDDYSDALEQALSYIVKNGLYGNLYIPQGTYPIKKTVRIPRAIRIIGYGENRPVFVLPEDAQGFDYIPDTSEKDSYNGGYPGANYMFWFVGNHDIENEETQDANAGTFYSAISNVDFRIEGHHLGAICVRAHFAQHGFISHCHFEIGDGLAGIYDVGNEMEDLSFEGGTYAMVCRMTSPGWPFALLDSHFANQRKAAILTTTTGFNGFRLSIKNTPRAFDLYMPGEWEKLYLEDCIFDRISDAVITTYNRSSVVAQTNVKNCLCIDCNSFINVPESNTRFTLQENTIVESCVYGYSIDDVTGNAEFKKVIKTKPFTSDRELISKIELSSDIPALPDMSLWKSVRDFGATGDGVTDDTESIRRAIEAEDIIYFPQGIYKVTDTIKMRENTAFIGLHPASTQIIITDDTESFEGFGTPKALIESYEGGNNLINGIGIDTAGKNPRACGLKWLSGAHSYVNDVKFMGGHGLMFRDGRNPFAELYNPSRTADYNPDRIWDFQYFSLWITQNGGGVFKDVWSASPYAEAGIAITNTSVKTRMYAISLEHHVRHEIKMNKVSNLSIFALQTEEEKAEGCNCLPMELVDCENVEIVSYYLFRVVAVNKNYDAGVKVWNCKNVLFKNYHNKAQMQYTFMLSLVDENTGFKAKSSDYALINITGNAKIADKHIEKSGFTKIISGFDFAQGAAVDSKNNLYWCDKLLKAVYMFEKSTGLVKPVIDIHYTPACLSFDSEDNLIVGVDYTALRKYVKGNPFQSHDRKSYHPFYSWFSQRGEKIYAIRVDDAYNSMTELRAIPASMVAPSYVIRCGEMDYPRMYEEVINRRIEEFYECPDHKTFVEKTIDLGRCTLLTRYTPGKKGVVCDDASRKSFLYDIDSMGTFLNPTEVAHRGQYGAWMSNKGTVWTIEDKLYGFVNNRQVSEHDVPEDALNLVGNEEEFYVIGRHSIYK